MGNKFEKQDIEYKLKRTEISKKYGERELWSIADHWPLYCGKANLNRFLAIYELLNSVENVPGNIAEFGCWRGTNLVFMAKVMENLDPHCSKLIYGFESFEGLTQFNRSDYEAIKQQGAYKGSFEELNDIISLYNLDNSIVIEKGTIEETLPKTLETKKGLSFSLVYIDTDLYASTKLILESLHNRLTKGGIFVLDEWNFDQWPGESIAVNEFMKDFGNYYEMETIKNTRQPSLVLRKVCT